MCGIGGEGDKISYIFCLNKNYKYLVIIRNKYACALKAFGNFMQNTIKMHILL